MNTQTVSGPFPSVIEKGNKTFWYFKSFTSAPELERTLVKLQRRGYRTFVIRKVGIAGLYTFPQTRWGMN